MKLFGVLLVAMVALALPVSAMAGHGDHKVLVCVGEHTVSVDYHAVSAVLRAHPGSYLGACVVTPGGGGDNPGDNPHPSVTPASPQNIALCYSVYQVVPAWFTRDQANALFAGGYWEPVAVLGNVDGGTNAGAYHLTCQTGGLKPTGSFVGGSGGQVFGPDFTELATTVAGFYPIVA